ncbi:MAG: serine/threonine-protein kinase [Thermoanaerobaculia bacterium]
MSQDHTPSPDADRTATMPDSGHEARVIGHYRLLQKLGEGGMGEVWEAEQFEPVQRRVALKLIKRGMDSAQVIARFESERQALALMDHPSIAKVFDAGTTERGRPYFVMELVHGVPITDYCDRHRMTVGQRLELFNQVCEGIQHAHQKAIIHRDIKPSNILITEQDGSPVPKIIDFGVAKATAQRLTERTLFTELGQLIGTPEYMSPEQAELTGEDIDIRTDVFSLGMVLYELLVGALPFDSKELRQVGLVELQRKIREDEPPRPSTQVTRLGDSSSTAAENRGTTVLALVKSLKGDLDWIIIKALEKDRSRRYMTAHALALDIGRFQRNEPVEARPPSAAYRIRKFVGRHRVGVAATGVVLVVLIFGILGTTFGLIRALHAEREARTEAETAQQISDFLVGLFKVADPGEARGNTITAREILDEGAKKIDRDLAGQPMVQSSLMHTMGIVFRSLGLYEEAESLLENSLTIRRSVVPSDDQRSASYLADLAWLYRSLGRHAEADALSREAIAVLEAIAPDTSDLARAYQVLGVVARDMGRFDESENWLQQSLAVGEAAPDFNPVLVGWAHYQLGWLHKLTGELKDARVSYEQALAILETELGPDSPEVAWCLNDLGVVHQDMGDFAESRRILERSLSIKEKILGPDHPDVAATANNVAVVLWYLGDYREAKLYWERTLEIRLKSLGPQHPDVGGALHNLGMLYRTSGNFAAAESFLENSLRISEEAYGLAHSSVASTLSELARLYAQQGEYEKAATYHRRSLDSFAASLGPDHPEVFYNQACYWALAGDREKALKYLQRSLELGRRAIAEDPDLVVLREDPAFQAIVARFE